MDVVVWVFATFETLLQMLEGDGGEEGASKLDLVLVAFVLIGGGRGRDCHRWVLSLASAPRPRPAVWFSETALLIMLGLLFKGSGRVWALCCRGSSSRGSVGNARSRIEA